MTPLTPCYPTMMHVFISRLSRLALRSYHQWVAPTRLLPHIHVDSPHLLWGLINPNSNIKEYTVHENKMDLDPDLETRDKGEEIEIRSPPPPHGAGEERESVRRRGERERRRGERERRRGERERRAGERERRERDGARVKGRARRLGFLVSGNSLQSFALVSVFAIWAVEKLIFSRKFLWARNRAVTKLATSSSSPRCISSVYHQQLCYCIVQFVEKDSKLADTVIRGPCEVAEREMFLCNNDHIRNLIIQNHKVIMPIVLPNMRGHGPKEVKAKWERTWKRSEYLAYEAVMVPRLVSSVNLASTSESTGNEPKPGLDTANSKTWLEINQAHRCELCGFCVN
ncbi:hypothetical protein YC2023_039315 [Brassica napus]